VRCVSRHFPARNISPYCRAPARTLDELLKMTPKRMLGAIAPAPDRRLTHPRQEYPNWNCRIVSWDAGP